MLIKQLIAIILGPVFWIFFAELYTLFYKGFNKKVGTRKMNAADIMIVIGFIVVSIVVLILLITGIYIFFIDRTHRQHQVLRNYSIVVAACSFFEKIRSVV